MEIYITRLTTLFSSLESLPLIQYLNDNAVIAGGSIVYALNEFVPKESVGDIDVFINDTDTYLQIINYIKENYSIDRMETIHPQDYLETDNSDNNRKISIVTIFLYKENVSIQLILEKYETPMDVIESFDLDYVQCAISNDQVYLTDACREAHESKRVICGKEFPPSLKRLQKATQKGFQTILMGNKTKTVPTTPIDTIPQEDQLEPINNLRKNINFKCTDVVAKSFVKNRINSFNGIKVIYGDVAITIDSEDHFKVKYIAIEIEVLEVKENIWIRFKPIVLDKYIIERGKNKSEQEISLGKHVVLVEFYRIDDNYDKSMRIIIHQVVDSNVTPISLYATSIPVAIANLPAELRRSHRHILQDIHKLMKKHANESEDVTDRLQSKMEWAKHQAYNAFLYHLEEGEHKAIQLACQQITYDSMKYKKNIPRELGFSIMMDASRARNMRQMIKYIETM